MNLIIFCLALGLNSILSADDVSSSIVSEMKHPGYWPEPFYPPNAETGWGYPPRPPPYPVDFNEGIEGNLFFNKSNKLIYTPDDGDGVLGLNNLIGDKFVPAITPLGTTNLTYFLNTTCSQKWSSVISTLSISTTIPFLATCNGLQTYITQFVYNVTIGGTTQLLTIPRLKITLYSLNGNFIQANAGAISTPSKCAGGYYWSFDIYVPRSQYLCVTTGFDYLTTIYHLSLITGKCQSTCWLEKGSVQVNPPINNLGAVNG